MRNLTWSLAALGAFVTAPAAHALPSFCVGDLAAPKGVVVLLQNQPGEDRMWKMANRFVECGWNPDDIFNFQIPVPDPGIDDCHIDLANHVKDLIDGVKLARGVSKVDVISYSLQCTVTRSYLSFLAGYDSIRRTVFWGSPNNGSDNIAPNGVCAFNELRTDGAFIPCLNGDTPGAPGCSNPFSTATPHGITPSDPPGNGVLYVNIYSADDLLLSQTQLFLDDTATNIEIHGVPHGAYPDSDLVLRSTMSAITGVILDPDGDGTPCGTVPGGPAPGWGAAVLALAPLAAFGWLGRRAKRSA
ncbi:MAG: hypothetical protein KC466_05360 [Myxococcales bacterium]|nr:hypothetical protein [Myxococcales bacterium]